MGMAQTCQEGCLALELALRFGIGVEVFFERDANLQCLIEGQINGPHSTLAELAVDPVAVVESRSQRQDHGSDCIRSNEGGQSSLTATFTITQSSMSDRPMRVGAGGLCGTVPDGPAGICP